VGSGAVLVYREEGGRLEVRERPDWWGPPIRERREKGVPVRFRISRAGGLFPYWARLASSVQIPFLLFFFLSFIYSFLFS
jgi:hypothetical protein